MAKASIKDCWSKISARIRNYLDVVDSYYRPSAEDELDGDTTLRPSNHSRPGAVFEGNDFRTPRGLISHGGGKDVQKSGSKRSSTNNACKHEKQQRVIHRDKYEWRYKSPEGGQLPEQDIYIDGDHHHPDNRLNRRSHDTSNSLSSCTPQQRLSHSTNVTNHQSQSHHSAHNQESSQHGRHHHHGGLLHGGTRLSQMGYTKRKTNQGQIYFVDVNGNRDWHDPSVPKELINANLDLDTLIGPLTSNWEVRRTSSGKVYYTNHLKCTTQLTDPRLVAYKDSLMTYLKRRGTLAYDSIVANSGHNNLSNGRQHAPDTSTRPSQSLNRRNSLDNSSNVNAFSEQLPNQNMRSIDVQRPNCNQSLPGLNRTSREDADRLLNQELQSSTMTNSTRLSIRSNSTRDSPSSHPHHLHESLVNNQLRASNTISAPKINCPGDLTFYELNRNNNRKELFDKISFLRQELLKQQDLTHPCRISISRKRIFEDSFRAVVQMSPQDLKKRLLIKFRGEEGLDYGGVAREWFHLLSKEILNPAHGLFQYTSDDIYNLQISPDSGIVYREHLSYLNFCGRIIGMAVFHGHFIEGRFTLPFYKMLLNKPIKLDDIEFVDPELYRSLCWILENDITDVIDTTFLVQHNAFGQLQEYELKDNGRNINVTEENKWEYVTLYVNYRCRRGIENQFGALQKGFYEIISPILVDNFDEYELELLIGGLSKIDIDDWRLNTKLKNCTVETPLIIWFWDIVKSYDEDKRARLLQFVTGSPRVPIQGFKALQGVNSELRMFTIHLIRNGNSDNLPKSHTCFNRIDLPPYETYEKLRDKLTQAIEETIGFAMQ